MENNIITLDHGSGGKLSNQLIHSLFFKHFNNCILNQGHDGAILKAGNQKMAFSTDSFTVSPIFFPGGNIGHLAIHGTVNDIAMCGAVPKYLSVSVIMEEGMKMDELEKITISMRESARSAGVKIVTGDTKVVNRGDIDQIFINTTGIGFIDPEVNINANQAQPGDLVIINGPIGNHGISIMASRENLQLEKSIKSDTASLANLVQNMLEVTKEMHVLRDPTRGGLATALNEIAHSSHVGIEIVEEKIPIQEKVKNACEILGYDPLYLANEGKLVAFVPPKAGEAMLKKMKSCPNGQYSAIIGRVTYENKGKVFLQTRIGGQRIVGMLSGQQLPRIC